MIGAGIVGMQRGFEVSRRLGGAGLLLCPLTLLLAAAPVGEAAQLVAGAMGLVLFATGLMGLRQLATGVGLPALLAVVAMIGIAAEVIGTIYELSGVVITVPLLLAIAVVFKASRWRAGDLALVGLALTLGFGLAYVLDNFRYDDNGSATDQAALVMGVPSLVLAVWAIVRTRAVSRAARVAVLLGLTLAVAAFFVAVATGDSTYVVVVAPAVPLLGFGLVGAGVGLLRDGGLGQRSTS